MQLFMSTIFQWGCNSNQKGLFHVSRTAKGASKACNGLLSTWSLSDVKVKHVPGFPVLILGSAAQCFAIGSVVKLVSLTLGIHVTG